jgi:guanylate kinase
MAIVAISGYSTAGKTYAAHTLPELQFCQLTSVTTRDQRPGEFPGLDYDYVSDSEFHMMLANDELIEHVSYCGYRYGLKKSALTEILNQGLIPCHVCTPDGVEALREYAEANDQLFISAFVEADIPTILHRMIKRWQTMPRISLDYLADRIATAISTESLWSGDYHFIAKNSNELISTAQHILDCCTGKEPLPQPVFREPMNLEWSYETLLPQIKSLLQSYKRPTNTEASRDVTSKLIIDLFHQ